MPLDSLLPHLLPTSLQMLLQQILLASSWPTALRPRTGPRELAAKARDMEKVKARMVKEKEREKEKARTARERERTTRTMARVRARTTTIVTTPPIYRSSSKKLKQHFKPADKNSKVAQVVSMTLSTVCLVTAVLVMPKGKLETLVVLTRMAAWGSSRTGSGQLRLWLRCVWVLVTMDFDRP
jgi:hypothetical protein